MMQIELSSQACNASIVIEMRAIFITFPFNRDTSSYTLLPILQQLRRHCWPCFQTAHRYFTLLGCTERSQTIHEAFSDPIRVYTYMVWVDLIMEMLRFDCRKAKALDTDCHAIQGPPLSLRTYTLSNSSRRSCHGGLVTTKDSRHAGFSLFLQWLYWKLH